MKHWLKLNEIIYKRLIKGPASVERGSDRNICASFFIYLRCFSLRISFRYYLHKTSCRVFLVSLYEPKRWDFKKESAYRKWFFSFNVTKAVNINSHNSIAKYGQTNPRYVLQLLFSEKLQWLLKTQQLLKQEKK